MQRLASSLRRRGRFGQGMPGVAGGGFGGSSIDMSPSRQATKDQRAPLLMNHFSVVDQGEFRDTGRVAMRAYEYVIQLYRYDMLKERKTWWRRGLKLMVWI